jgi:hypothetical protein
LTRWQRDFRRNTAAAGIGRRRRSLRTAGSAVRAQRVHFGAKRRNSWSGVAETAGELFVVTQGALSLGAALACGVTSRTARVNRSAAGPDAAGGADAAAPAGGTAHADAAAEAHAASRLTGYAAAAGARAIGSARRGSSTRRLAAVGGSAARDSEQHDDHRAQAFRHENSSSIGRATMTTGFSRRGRAPVFLRKNAALAACAVQSRARATIAARGALAQTAPGLAGVNDVSRSRAEVVGFSGQGDT